MPTHQDGERLLVALGRADGQQGVVQVGVAETGVVGCRLGRMGRGGGLAGVGGGTMWGPTM
ncbi:hypothetical protein KUM39_00840 [Streptomyces sp. J2-1]|uniref:hypothetical protein n=1 Tax=Streptomyces corallincola TaxID=2851888 RepID=UPI001C380329|nr:hypothetical protein [Streptomyces corallincola]MBV2352916.1 hypothetical protein [Streptomyces corallincola]